MLGAIAEGLNGKPMMPTPAARRPFLLGAGPLAAAVGLAACQTQPVTTADEAPSDGGGAGASLPTFQKGDRLVYDAPDHTRRVTSVLADRVQWNIPDAGSMVTPRNPFVPPLRWSGGGGNSGSQSVEGDPDALFPLKVGRSVRFTTSGKNRKSGKQWTLDWQCEATKRHRLSVPAGSFNTVRVVCDNRMMTQTYDYAPAIGYWVRKRQERQGRDPRTIELVDFKRGDMTAAKWAKKKAEEGTSPSAQLKEAAATRAALEEASKAEGDSGEKAALEKLTSRLESLINRLEKAVRRAGGDPDDAHAAAAAEQDGAGQDDGSPRNLSETKKTGSSGTDKPAVTEEARARREAFSAPSFAATPGSGDGSGDSGGTDMGGGQYRAEPGSGDGPPVGVQLGAFKTRADARAAWNGLQQKHPDLLARLDLAISKVDIPMKGTFFRVVAGPIKSNSAAKRLCGTITDRGGNCLVSTFNKQD